MVAASESVDLGVDANKRFRDELVKELERTQLRLARSNADCQEAARSAMDLASRLDACESKLAEAVEQTEAKNHELTQLQATISKQNDYIQRLRQQIKDPVRLLAKRFLGPVRNTLRKDDGR